MTPADAVALLAELVAPQAKLTEDAVYDALAAAGVPFPVADRAFKFTQTAWGRVALDGTGVQFAPGYLGFNGGGDVTESGTLADEPYYAAARKLAPRYAAAPGFMAMVMMSADFSAINGALNAGSKPENLRTGPAAFFFEPATPAGLAKAQAILSERVRGAGAGGKRPWWRFWG